MRLHRYPSYKQTKIKYIGELPEHWTVKALKRVSPAQTVGIVVNPSAYISEEGLPFIYGGDIREGEIDLENCRKIEKSLSASQAKTLLEANDLLTVRVGDPGVTAVVPEAANGGNCASVMLIKSGNFDSRWLCYLMNSRTIRYQVELVQYGAAQEQFNISHAKEFKCPTPPICEQAQIANFLDHESAKIDALVAEQERLIGLLKEKQQAVISNAVTKGLNPDAPMKDSGVEWLGEAPEHWKIKKLSWISNVSKGKEAQTLTKEYCAINNGEYPVYSGQTSNEGVMGSLNRYEFDQPDGCLLITTVGSQKVMSIRRITGRFSLSQNCMIASPDGTQVSSGYLSYALQPCFDFYRNLIPQHMQASFRMEDYYSIRILIPELDEQRKITSYLDEQSRKVNAQISVCEETVALLSERRSALISAAVTGQIDLRGLVAEEEAA